MSIRFFFTLAFSTEALFPFEFFSSVVHRVVSIDTFLTSLNLLLSTISCVFLISGFNSWF